MIRYETKTGKIVKISLFLKTLFEEGNFMGKPGIGVIFMKKIIHNYIELYEFVLAVKRKYNLEFDEVEIIDKIIFNNFNEGNTKLLSSCYKSFNKYLDIKRDVSVQYTKGTFKMNR